MNVIEATLNKLSDIQHYLDHLHRDAYVAPLAVLSNSSVGEHTRHILEFYQCLLVQSDQGKVNYDLRERNQSIEQDPDQALVALRVIIRSLPRYELKRTLDLEICYDENHELPNVVKTSMERELVYNLEHVIHHLAIIKIGLQEVAPALALPQGFGVAPSTIRYRNACAQ